MKCNTCKEEGILNHALSKEFWYCRSCKEEILPPKPLEKSPGRDYNEFNAADSKEMDEWLNTLQGSCF